MEHQLDISIKSTQTTSIVTTEETADTTGRIAQEAITYRQPLVVDYAGGMSTRDVTHVEFDGTYLSQHYDWVDRTYRSEKARVIIGEHEQGAWSGVAKGSLVWIGSTIVTNGSISRNLMGMWQRSDGDWLLNTDYIEQLDLDNFAWHLSFPKDNALHDNQFTANADLVNGINFWELPNLNLIPPGAMHLLDDIMDSSQHGIAHGVINSGTTSPSSTYIGSTKYDGNPDFMSADNYSTDNFFPVSQATWIQKRRFSLQYVRAMILVQQQLSGHNPEVTALQAYYVALRAVHQSQIMVWENPSQYEHDVSALPTLTRLDIDDALGDPTLIDSVYNLDHMIKLDGTAVGGANNYWSGHVGGEETHTHPHETPNHGGTRGTFYTNNGSIGRFTGFAGTTEDERKSSLLYATAGDHWALVQWGATANHTINLHAYRLHLRAKLIEVATVWRQDVPLVPPSTVSSTVTTNTFPQSGHLRNPREMHTSWLRLTHTIFQLAPGADLITYDALAARGLSIELDGLTCRTLPTRRAGVQGEHRRPPHFHIATIAGRRTTIAERHSIGIPEGVIPLDMEYHLVYSDTGGPLTDADCALIRRVGVIFAYKGNGIY